MRLWGLQWTLFGASLAQDEAKRGQDGDKMTQVGAKRSKMRPRRSKKEAKRVPGGGTRKQNGARWGKEVGNGGLEGKREKLVDGNGPARRSARRLWDSFIDKDRL